MVTIQDVARAAGVSPMTVSNVINSHRYVRDETRERVLRTMAELDYRVNVAARNLRSGRTFTIALAVSEFDRPYYGQLAARLSRYAADHGLKIVMEETGHTRDSEIDAIALSRNRMYDGVILSAVNIGQADADRLPLDYPVVLLGERIFDGPVDHVAMDNVGGSRAAVLHLAERGATRIAIASEHKFAADTDVSALRREGYRQGLEEAGLEWDERLVAELASLTMHAGQQSVARLLASDTAFDAVFCATDTVAIGVMRGLADAGLRVPDDVRVIGFDDIDEASYLTPSLSTIDPDHDAMARQTIQLLVERISEGNTRPPREVIPASRVVARESTT